MARHPDATANPALSGVPPLPPNPIASGTVGATSTEVASCVMRSPAGTSALEALTLAASGQNGDDEHSRMRAGWRSRSGRQ